MNHSHYTDPNDIRLNTIENAVYMSMKNDVSFLIADTLNFYEQQSTFNPNMPMRFFIYAGMVYNKVDMIRANQKITDTLEDAIDAALDQLPDDSVIKPFLTANKAEVKYMCITEYDEERTFAEQREEGREEGRLSMVIELVKEGILTIKQAADRMQMTVPELEAEMAMNA